MRVQTYLLAAVSLGMALFLLFHFGCIWKYGEFVICEPNTGILVAETVGIVCVLAFSSYCIIDQLVRGPRHR